MDNTGRIIDTIFSFYRCMREKSGIKSPFASLSIVQLQTLIFLAKTTSSSMTDIAQYLHIELPSATTLVENLVKTGLVSKKQDKNDKRSVHIFLTVKGKRLLQKAKKERGKRLSVLLTTLTATEKKQFLLILTKLTKQMEEQHEK
ncbi:MAG TPA: MarR family transcriptional regulator [Patescibacteria group bacterium]|nr:MarR family transcriptional regulator [Patescibacteria group bacterium]